MKRAEVGLVSAVISDEVCIGLSRDEASIVEIPLQPGGPGQPVAGGEELDGQPAPQSAAQDPFATVRTVKQTLPTLARLFYRSLGRLAIITLAVEEAAGLKRDPQDVDPGVIVAEAQA